MYSVGRLLEDLRVISKEPPSDYWQKTALQIIEEALTVFFSEAWPWTAGEDSINTLAPYRIGTIALTKDSKNVVGTGTVWSGAWPTPAVVRPALANGHAYLVNFFVSGTQLTLDKEWPFASDPAATYEIDFPSYDVPSYIGVDAMMRSRVATWSKLTPSTPEAILAERANLPAAFYPNEFYATPGDGTTSMKVFLWPPPAEVQTIRYRYTKSVPAMYYYGVGSASVNNASPNVAGSGSLWQKLGYSINGQIFEFRIASLAAHQIAVQSVTTDTALVLAVNYTGPNVVTQPYMISPKILVADDMRPLLRALVRWRYYEETNPQLAAIAQGRYQSLLAHARSRSNVVKEAQAVEPIEGVLEDRRWDAPPAIPYLLRDTP